MSWGRLRRYADRVRAELHRSLTDDYTPHRVASSFALGTFVTMLPTLGSGLLVLSALAYLSDWLNKVAMFASVVVFNPVVKWGVYALSIALGFTLLGSVEGVSISSRPGFGDGPAIVVRLLLGNTILAVIATAGAYVVAYQFASAYDPRDLPMVGDTIDHLAEEPEHE
jgi:uncharacterized protein (DUF2062 family)